MTRLALSNVQLRSNLRSEDYQQEMGLLTVFEVKDIWRRNPMLRAPDALTPRQKEEWKDHLFWGERVVSLEDDDRGRAWLEALAESVEPALEAIEERPTYEEAFELLVVTEQLKAEALGSWYGPRAADWSRRTRAVLARDEFRLTPAIIDQRLAEILGLSVLPGPAEVSLVPSLPPESLPTVPAPGAGRLPAEVAKALSSSSVAEVDPPLPVTASPLRQEAEGPPSSATPPPAPPINRLTEAKPPRDKAAAPAADGGTVAAVAVATPSTLPTDPHLERLIRAWPTLPEHVKASMILLLKAVEIVSSTRT